MPTKTPIETIKDALLIASIVGNIAFGAANVLHQRDQAQRDTAQKADEARRQNELLELQRLAHRPQITFTRLIFPGQSIKLLPSANLKGALIGGTDHAEFVETAFGRQLYDIVGRTNQVMMLEGIEAEFLAFINSSNASADRIWLTGDGEKQDLGPLGPNTTKLVPVAYRQSHPFSENRDERIFRRYSYEYAVAGKPFETTAEIPPAGPTSWIPTLDTFRGVGRALISQETAHLLRPLP